MHLELTCGEQQRVSDGAPDVVRVLVGNCPNRLPKHSRIAHSFEQVLAEYQKAPEVTRDRLYLEAMEEVLANSSKLMIDQKGGNNVIYLPLDQLMRQRAGQGAESGFTQSLSTSSSGSSDSTTDSSRSRGSRSALRERGDN